jgi:hypothetical protein
MDCQYKSILLTNKFPELYGQRREDLCAAFSEAVEWGREDQKQCIFHPESMGMDLPVQELKTVKDIIDELSKMPQHLPALFYCMLEVSDKIAVGYTPFSKIQIKKVERKKDSWYEESDKPDAIDVVVMADL